MGHKDKLKKKDESAISKAWIEELND